MSVRIVAKVPVVKKPRRSTQFSAGYDVFSSQNIRLVPGVDTSITMPVGLDFDPQKYKVVLFLRSSIGIKKHVRFVENGKVVPFIELHPNQESTGKVIQLRYVGEEEFIIEKGMHFAQFIVMDKKEKYVPFTLEKVEDLRGNFPVSVSFVERGNSKILILEEDIALAPGERILLPSGLKSKFAENAFLGAFLPEGEKRFRFSNGAAVIDSDYYFSDIEGNIFISIENNLQENLLIKTGTPIVEFKCITYHLVDNEIAATAIRTSGIGSTTK